MLLSGCVRFSGISYERRSGVSTALILLDDSCLIKAVNVLAFLKLNRSQSVAVRLSILVKFERLYRTPLAIRATVTVVKGRKVLVISNLSVERIILSYFRCETS